MSGLDVCNGIGLQATNDLFLFLDLSALYCGVVVTQ